MVGFEKVKHMRVKERVEGPGVWSAQLWVVTKDKLR